MKFNYLAALFLGLLIPKFCFVMFDFIKVSHELVYSYYTSWNGLRIIFPSFI